MEKEIPCFEFLRDCIEQLQSLSGRNNEHFECYQNEYIVCLPDPFMQLLVMEARQNGNLYRLGCVPENNTLYFMGMRIQWNSEMSVVIFHPKMFLFPDWKPCIKIPLSPAYNLTFPTHTAILFKLESEYQHIFKSDKNKLN